MIRPLAKPLPQLVALGDVKKRVDRALMTVRALDDREHGWLKVKSTWTFPTVDSYSDKLSQAEKHRDREEMAQERAMRFKPTRADLDDVHTALGWFNRLSLSEKLRTQQIRAGKSPFSPEQRVLWLYSLNLSFRQIGFRLGGISDDTARARYNDAAHICWRWANVDAAERLDGSRTRLAAAG